MSDSIIVRKAGIEDAAIMSSIGVLSWQAAYHGIIPDTYLDSLSIEKKEVQVAKSLTIPENYFALAEIYNQGVGVICYRPDYAKDKKEQGSWEIEALYIIPQYWRKGIGQSLIKYAIRHMRSMIVSSCGLWVLFENHRARKFYESMGFCLSDNERAITIGGKELIEVNYTIDINDVLNKEIYNLELQLLRPEVRTSSEKLAELLCEDMTEFCSSGNIYRYTRNDVIDQSINSSTLLWEITNFMINSLSNDIILATYLLDKNDDSNNKPSCSTRSSIWKYIDGKWKMYFHQGTPIIE